MVCDYGFRNGNSGIDDKFRTASRDDVNICRCILRAVGIRIKTAVNLSKERYLALHIAIRDRADDGAGSVNLIHCQGPGITVRGDGISIARFCRDIIYSPLICKVGPCFIPKSIHREGSRLAVCDCHDLRCIVCSMGICPQAAVDSYVEPDFL